MAGAVKQYNSGACDIKHYCGGGDHVGTIVICGATQARKMGHFVWDWVCVSVRGTHTHTHTSIPLHTHPCTPRTTGVVSYAHNTTRQHVLFVTCDTALHIPTGHTGGGCVSCSVVVCCMQCCVLCCVYDTQAGV